MSESIRIEAYEELIREVLDSGGEFRIYPHGVSMLPLLRQGRDSVSLRRLDREPRKQDILFYRRSDGSYILHRVKAVTPRGMTLWGDHQYIPEYGIAENQIIGYAARIFRDEHELDCRSLAYRMYLWLWQFKAIRMPLLRLAYLFEKGDRYQC